MGKIANIFVCQSCGSVHGKWAGRCDSCGQWNSLVEEIPALNAPKNRRHKKSRGIEFVDLAGVSADVPRLKTGIAELDRVTGGGLVPGSCILIGGDPGIGKSTLLLQSSCAMAKAGIKTAYISGEEATAQVRRRAKRLGLDDAPVHLAAETSLGPIIDGLMEHKPDVIIIDSIQTMWSDPFRRSARHRRTSASLCPRTDPLRQETRGLHNFSWPCHQGRANRRTSRGRTYGRRGFVFRRRPS